MERLMELAASLQKAQERWDATFNGFEPDLAKRVARDLERERAYEAKSAAETAYNAALKEAVKAGA